MTVTIQTVSYCNFGDGSTTGYYAVPLWTLNTAYTVGQIVRQKTTPAVGSERCFICTIAGTSSNTTEPTWILTRGAKMAADNGVVQWFEATGLPGLNGDLTNTPLSSQNRSGLMPIGAMITNNTQDHYYWCTTAGTTGAGEPTLTTVLGSGTSDGTATWTCIGPVSSFTTAWHAPQARMGNVAATWVAAGGTVYVSAISAETSAATSTLTATGTAATSVYTSYLCVSNTPSLPPVAADLTTGATMSTSGTSAPLTVSGTGFLQGISFVCGSLASGQSLTVASTATGWMRFLNCNFTLGGSSGQSLLLTAESSMTILENTTVTFSGGATAAIQLIGGKIVWRNTSPALIKTGGGSWPTTLFSGASQGSGTILFENLDFSTYAGTQLLGSNSGTSRIVLSNCKLPSLTSYASTNNLSGPHSSVLDMINCDTGGNTYNQFRYAWEGTQLVNTSAVRTGGASNGTTAFSWQITTSANAKWLIPFESLPILVWNPTTAANVTVTIEGAYVGTALPTTTDIWIDVNYFGTSSSTLGTLKTTTAAGVLSSGSPWGASSSALWGGSASARANSHAYVLGDLIGVLSAPSGTIVRLFQCTTAGTSSGSLPGGYASAVDGGQITDGTAVFTAVERFQLTTTLSTPQPQSAGYFNIYVRAAKATAIYYLDPFVTLS